MPDGVFSKQKCQFGSIMEGLAMAIWYTYFVVIWYIFPRFGMLRQKNLANLNTLD
jgi:hypothetical protein